VKGVKVVKGIVRGEEYQKMLIRLEGRTKILRVLFELGCSTGYRISDMLLLRARDVLKRNLRVVESKTGKIRHVEITKALRRVLRSYTKEMGLKDNDWLFSLDGKKPITRQYAHKAIKQAGEEIGLEGMGTHSMRKTYAFNLLLNTNSFFRVQESLNHRYMSTTMVYLLDGVLEVLPKLGRKRAKPCDYKTSNE